MRQLNIPKDRIEIAKIIFRNMELLKSNPKGMSQEISDCILLYLIEKRK